MTRKQPKIIITKFMKKRIVEYENKFLSLTNISHRTVLRNGFFGIGVLNTPNKHLGRKNNVWLYFVGLSHNGKKIIESTSLMLTFDEVNDLKNSLVNVIKRIKNVNGRCKKWKEVKN